MMYFLIGIYSDWYFWSVFGPNSFGNFH